MVARPRVAGIAGRLALEVFAAVPFREPGEDEVVAEEFGAAVVAGALQDRFGLFGIATLIEDAGEPDDGVGVAR